LDAHAELAQKRAKKFREFSADSDGMLTPAPFADPRKMSKTHMSGQSAAVARSARPAKRAKLANDVRPMMYGFGDSVQPLDESVDLVEDIVIDFLTNLVLLFQFFFCR
jgi:hypothetical protein